MYRYEGEPSDPRVGGRRPHAVRGSGVRIEVLVAVVVAAVIALFAAEWFR